MLERWDQVIMHKVQKGREHKGKGACLAFSNVGLFYRTYRPYQHLEHLAEGVTGWAGYLQLGLLPRICIITCGTQTYMNRGSAGL